MKGQPYKKNNRDKQYRVRLNNEEDEKLNFCSKETGELKSEIFRKALDSYYENVKLLKNIQNEYDATYDDNEEYMLEMDHISLKRSIECPYCGNSNNIDFSEDCDTTSEERQMGPQIEYSFDWEDYECESCGKYFGINGSIWEYPVGAYNHQDINIIPYEDDDEN